LFSPFTPFRPRIPIPGTRLFSAPLMGSKSAPPRSSPRLRLQCNPHLHRRICQRPSCASTGRFFALQPQERSSILLSGRICRVPHLPGRHLQRSVSSALSSICIFRFPSPSLLKVCGQKSLSRSGSNYLMPVWRLAHKNSLTTALKLLAHRLPSVPRGRFAERPWPPGTVLPHAPHRRPSAVGPGNSAICAGPKFLCTARPVFPRKTMFVGFPNSKKSADITRLKNRVS
jgi:hypothetical protein